MVTVIFEQYTKRQQGRTVVNGLDLRARPGRVTAVLGPNGAGKTSALRGLLGLEKPSAGRATFSAGDYPALADPAAVVGATFDDMGFHPGRTGRNQLRVFSAAGGFPDARVDEVLDETELIEVADRRIRTYSTGMKKRLSLAAALLGDPTVLILDEPTNGLDPYGVHWIRKAVRRWADEGRTVLICTHVLNEIAPVTDDVAILQNGKLVTSGSLADLTGGEGQSASLEELFLKATGMDL